MKKYFLLCSIFLFPFVVVCQENTVFSNLIKYGESEKFDLTFETTNGSKMFIDTFELNKVEIGFIGFWTDNFYSEIKQNGKNVKIAGLDFFPNRIMEMHVECYINGSRIWRYFFFKWQIKEKKLELKPLLYFSKDKDNISSAKFIDSTDYENAGKIEFYEDNYILTKQFDFSFLNKYLQEKEIEFCKDDFRYRILSGRALPSIYDRLGTDAELRKFQLNFNVENVADYIKLSKHY